MKDSRGCSPHKFQFSSPIWLRSDRIISAQVPSASLAPRQTSSASAEFRPLRAGARLWLGCLWCSNRSVSPSFLGVNRKQPKPTPQKTSSNPKPYTQDQPRNSQHGVPKSTIPGFLLLACMGQTKTAAEDLQGLYARSLDDLDEGSQGGRPKCPCRLSFLL